MLIGPTEYLRITIDPLRLAILGRAAVGPVDPDALAAELHEDSRRVRRETGRLVEAGLLGRDLRLDRAELRRIQIENQTTTVYVTHDQIEALTMADRIGVLNRGKLIQVGTPEDIYDRPFNTYVAKLVGTPRINLLAAEKVNGVCRLTDLGIELDFENAGNLPEKFILGVRPEDVTLNPAGQFGGEISITEPLGVETVVHIQRDSGEILCLASGLERCTAAWAWYREAPPAVPCRRR